jgi:hypothetical protein
MSLATHVKSLPAEIREIIREYVEHSLMLDNKKKYKLVMEELEGRTRESLELQESFDKYREGTKSSSEKVGRYVSTSLFYYMSVSNSIISYWNHYDQVITALKLMKFMNIEHCSNIPNYAKIPLPFLHPELRCNQYNRILQRAQHDVIYLNLWYLPRLSYSKIMKELTNKIPVVY